MKYPSNCNKPYQKYTVLLKAKKTLIDWHNSRSTKIDNLYRKREAMYAQEKNIVTKDIKQTDYHNANSNRSVYPETVNQANESSKLDYLLCLEDYQENMTEQEKLNFGEALGQAKQEAMNSSYWNVSVEDLDGV